MGQRTYKSPLREEHTRRTREVILDALVEIAGNRPVGDLVVAELAERAGVATRTVYRHFPDRTALLDALGEHTRARGAWPLRTSDLTTPDEMVEAIPRAFAQFEDHPSETRAMVALNTAGDAAISRQNYATIRDLLAESASGLDPDDVDGVAAILHLLASSRTWVRLRDEVGLDADQTHRAIAWAAHTLVGDLIE